MCGRYVLCVVVQVILLHGVVCIVLYYTVLYCTVLYCTVLCCIVLYSYYYTYVTLIVICNEMMCYCICIHYLGLRMYMLLFANRYHLLLSAAGVNCAAFIGGVVEAFLKTTHFVRNRCTVMCRCIGCSTKEVRCFKTT